LKKDFSFYKFKGTSINKTRLFDAIFKLNLSVSQTPTASLFLIEGSAEIAGDSIKKRDAVGVWETDRFNLKMASNSRVLLIEVPLNL
jgi:hypothetical protein